MGNKWSMSNMGNKWGMSKKWGTSNKWGMSNKWGTGNKWGMGNHWSIGSWMCNSLGVGSSSLIGDLSNISTVVISTIPHSLNTAIWEVDRVGTLNNTISIIRFSLVEGSARVVISNSIIVTVGRDLSKIRGTISSSRMAIDWSMSNRVSNGNSGGIRTGKSNRVGNGMR